jgi:hypothetical protein
MARRGEITGRKPRTTAGHAKRSKIPNAASPIIEPDPNAIEPTVHGESSSSSCAKAMPIRGPPVPSAMFTIATFCAAHHISEAFYFKLKSQNLHPIEMRLGSRVFITFESASKWRKAREKATPRVKPSPSPKAA